MIEKAKRRRQVLRKWRTEYLEREGREPTEQEAISKAKSNWRDMPEDHCQALVQSVKRFIQHDGAKLHSHLVLGCFHDAQAE